MWVQKVCRTVCDQLGTDRQSIGWQLFLERMFMITERSTTVWRPVSNRSVVSQWLKTVLGLSATIATCQRLVANQSLTSRRPPCDHQKPFCHQFGSREVSLAASKTSLWPNHPCDICNLSATSQRLSCDLSPTSLWPPEIMVQKEVTGRLQAMCDRGFRGIEGCYHDCLIIPLLQRSGKGCILVSPCPSVRLLTESCPLCIFNNTHWIHFIFAHLIKQLQKVCHM